MILVGIFMDLAVSSGLLGCAAQEGIVFPSSVEHQPLIDVFQDGESATVLVLLPGVKKEDASAQVKGQSIRISVTVRGTTHEMEIPCSFMPSEVKVESVTGTIPS